MCLAIPGRIIDLNDDTPLTRTGRVGFGGTVKKVNLSAVPRASVGDYVLVHAGFAISVVDADEAARTFEYLAQLEVPTDNAESGP